MKEMIDLISVFVQVPILAAFIFFALKWTAYVQGMGAARDQHLQDFLKELREQDRAIMEMLIKEVKTMINIIDKHDRKTDHAITLMTERTRSKPAKKDLEE